MKHSSGACRLPRQDRNAQPLPHPASSKEEVLGEARRGERRHTIGTHRLLSKDVQFQDLGLLVVDEEQRFGVAHKERLKEMRTATWMC